MRTLVLVLVMLAGQAAMAETLEAEMTRRLQKAEPARVLFVGNSYSFQVPKVFASLAKSEGRKIVVEQVTKGGWTLARHAKTEATLARIRDGRWDVVVLQEQSQTPAFPKAQREQGMIPAARTLVAEIRKAGAIPAMFVTWGRRDGDQQNAKTFPDDTMEAMQARLDTGYREAADEAGGAVLVPVGPAWLRAKKAGQMDGLFAKDGSHPTKDGVYLSACVFYVTFYDTGVRKTRGREKELAEIAAGVGISATH
jgi:hypothetical protein